MTKPRPDQPGRCPSIDPHDTLQCTRAIHDDDQCSAGGIAWRKGSPRIEWDRERADRLQEDVERMQKDVERLTAERDWYKDRFPCDGGCVDEPEETCSRHGRSPADLWRIIGEVAAERNALTAKVARAEALAEDWRYKGQFGWGPWQIGEGPDPEGYVMDHCAFALRDALAGSEADTSDTQPTDQEDQS
jgi:hypothetical protein